MDKNQLELRVKEIRQLLESDEAIDLDALEVEMKVLTEKRATIEKREQMLAEATNINNDNAQHVNKVHFFNGQNHSKEDRNEDATDGTAYRNAFMDYVLRDAEIPRELRNEVTQTSDVGTVIPQTLINQIIQKLEATGMILPLVKRTSIRGGVSIPVSKIKPTAIWVSEGKGSQTQKGKTGEISFKYHKLRCAVSTTLEVDTMALSSFEQMFVSNVIEAMTKALEQAIISGSGVGQPKGILTETPEEGQELKVGKIDYQTLIDAESALPMEYENGAVWTMTKKTFMAFYGMVDDNGQPVARLTNGINGKPERTLLGRSVVLINYIPSFKVDLAANTVFAFLFNYKDYILNTNYAIGVRRFQDNSTDDWIRVAVMIADGRVAIKNSLVTLKKVDVV